MHLLDLFKSLPPWMLLFVGTIAGRLGSMWNTVYDHTIGYVIKKVTVSVTVEDKRHQSAYSWLSLWVEGHLAKRNVTSLLLAPGKTGTNNLLDCVSTDTSDDDDEENARIGYRVIPSYGTYYMMWRGRPMVVSHTVDNTGGGMSSAKSRIHTIHIQLWFCRKRKMVLDLLAEAQNQYYTNLPPSVEYRVPGQYGNWNMTRIPPRPMESVYLPDNIIRDIESDVDTFLKSQKKFEALGIPYRRGYMLTGPPGTGKSTLVVALASKFNLKVYAISLKGPEFTAERLNELLSSVMKPCILLFEDVDCYEVTTERVTEQTAPISLSDVLNALDGVGASESRIVIMTSNHPEKLDEALVRAGRIDKKYFLPPAGDAEIRKFYDRVNSLHPLPEWKKFRALLPEVTTIAEAQALAFSNTETISVEAQSEPGNQDRT